MIIWIICMKVNDKYVRVCFLLFHSFLFTFYLIVNTSEARENMSSEDAAGQTVEVLLRGHCVSWKRKLACLSSPYRTFDGSCNNLCDPTLGMANTPLIRLPGLRSPTAYEGNKFAPRATSKIGNNVPLPNARKVSVQVFVAGEGNARFRFRRPTPRGTHLVMTWGQFLDHDVTLTELVDEHVNCGTNAQPCPNKPNDCIGIDVDRSVRLERDPSAQCIPLRRSTRDRQGQQVSSKSRYLRVSVFFYKWNSIDEWWKSGNSANLVWCFVLDRKTSLPTLSTDLKYMAQVRRQRRSCATKMQTLDWWTYVGL